MNGPARRPREWLRQLAQGIAFGVVLVLVLFAFQRQQAADQENVCLVLRSQIAIATELGVPVRFEVPDSCR
jgi:hypothetical protein